MDEQQKQALIAELTAHREQLVRAAEKHIAEFSRLVDNAASGYVAVINKLKQQ
jgi:hypothetical protein